MPARRRQKRHRASASASSPITIPAGRRQKRHRASASASPPLGDFFAKYSPQFVYDATKSASHEFYRLCNEFGWNRDNPEREDAHCNFKDALVKQFNEVYGTDAEDLGNWQNLCYIVKIDPIPDGLHACREAVRGTFVNLVDLVDTDVTGEDVELFESELKLSEYTKNAGKFFPKENAYAGGLLRYLLRHILHPATQVPSRRRTKKRR